MRGIDSGVLRCAVQPKLNDAESAPARAKATASQVTDARSVSTNQFADGQWGLQLIEVLRITADA